MHIESGNFHVFADPRGINRIVESLNYLSYSRHENESNCSCVIMGYWYAQNRRE